jgi:hypothetical protein
MTDRLRANANLVDSLGSAARHGGSALADAPVLLRRVLEEEAWREFVTQRGDHVKHRRFSEFVSTPPLKGLGADMTLIERIVGTSDPDLLVMLRQAEKLGRGSAGRGRPSIVDSESESPNGSETTDYLAQRLHDQHPDQYAAVKSGDLSINAAAVLAGIRPKRISIRLDRPASIAESLRKHLTPEQIDELRTLLADRMEQP